jgi:transglutaminase-like putative cysteine protease
VTTELKECPSASIANEPSVRYELHDRFTVPSLGSEVAQFDVWCPVICDSPYQRVLDIAVSAPVSWTLTREAGHGNPMLHARLAGPTGGETRFELRYVVERTAVAHALHPACVRPLENPALFAAYLGPEQFVEVNDKMRGLASDIVQGEKNPMLQAQRIYDYVVGSMTYDAAKQSWTGSSEHALVCSMGNCNDIHALFISLARSIGIPARLVLGQALEPPAPGAEACDLCGYHCWAEFFAAGAGWVPVDASCACKYAKHQLFGSLEMNHIAWSVGRDIRLVPAQQGAPLLFFAGPYAERDGKTVRLERHVSFQQF